MSPAVAGGEVSVGAFVSAASNSKLADPPSVSEDQAYYWSDQWQSGELAALQELARGDGRVFAGSSEALAWLLGESD